MSPSARASRRASIAEQLGVRGGRRVDHNLALLTDREREVLKLIADGNTNKEMAIQLAVSVNTVGTHRKHIMGKLDFHNAAEIVASRSARGL